MPRGDAVLVHPDREEITQRLLKGESVKSIEMWLKMKYNKNPKNWITWMTLQVYRKERLNLEGEVLNEIQQERKELLKQSREQQKKEIVENTIAYSEAKRRLAEDVLNVEQEIIDIHDKLWTRIKILETEETKHLNDKVICEYLSQARTLLVDFMKMRETQEKKSGDTNININMMQVTEQVNVLKQAIREALIEAGAENVVPLFLDKLNKRLNGLNYNEAIVKKGFNRNITKRNGDEPVVVTATPLVQDKQPTMTAPQINIQVNN